MATYRVNYGFKGTGNKLRSASLIINAKDVKDAHKAANDQLSKEVDWHTINSIKEVDSTKTIV